MKFSKESIALCKKIAEKHRKEIKYGDWYYDTGKQSVELWWSFGQEILAVDNTTIPLWQISDCLKFLRERKYWLRMDTSLSDAFSKARVWVFSELYAKKHWMNSPNYNGKTILEACLKAVLAIVEEKSCSK